MKKETTLNDYSYEIIENQSIKFVDNLTILYNSENRDKESIFAFIDLLKNGRVRPTNITIVDDIKANTILQDYTQIKSTPPEDIEFLKKHWIALSTFEGLNLMYPER